MPTALSKDGSSNEAALSPVRPLQLGEQVYLCRPPTLSVVGTMTALMRKYAVRQTPLASLLSDPAWQLLPTDLQREMCRVAVEAQVAGNQTVDPQSILDQLYHPDVVALGIWACCHGQHPELTLAAVRAQITESNALETFVLFDEASGMMDLVRKFPLLAGPSG